MSSQRGNVKRRGPPKHPNKTAFKNNKHDTSKLTKALNSMTIGGVCDKCRETIEWKIKYKKYKPLTQPKKCTKCSQKTVKHAYTIICASCATDQAVCAKCGSKDDSINPFALTPTEEAAQNSKMEAELQALSERKRRAFFRQQNKGFPDEVQTESAKEAEYFEDKETEDISDEDEDEEKDFSDTENGPGEKDILQDDSDLTDGTDGIIGQDKQPNTKSRCEKDSEFDHEIASNTASSNQQLLAGDDNLVDIKDGRSSQNVENAENTTCQLVEDVS